jgi:hypothetical protein
MNKRVGVLAVLLVCIVLAAALAVGAIGCGGGSTTTTVAPATTTSAAPATTAPAATTATSAAAETTSTAGGATGSSTAASVEVTPEMAAYKTAMTAWATAMMTLPSTGDPSEFTDITKLTDAEKQAATAFVGAIHSVYDQLKAIQAPAQYAAAQKQIVDGIGAMVDATDKIMLAIQKGDTAAFAAAQKEGQAVADSLQGLMTQLAPLFGLTTPSS